MSKASPQVTQAPRLDPRTLLVDVNVRHAATADADLIASIRDVGVLQPIVAVRTADGQVRVRYGHRRTLAAIEAELSTVPVLIVADEATDDAGQVERLVTQWAENEHRTGLTQAEQVDVIGQLSAFGISAAQIAKRTKTSRTKVDAALVVMGSDLAREATARYDFLDLTQAAVVAEFEDDPEAVTALVAAAQVGRFEHAAQRARDDRSERARIAAKADELRAAGVTVVDRPGWEDSTRRVTSLVDQEGKSLDTQAHTECPGHAVFVDETRRWVDAAQVPADAVRDGEDDYGDEEDYDEDEGAPEDNANADDDQPEPPARVWIIELIGVPVCVEWASHGHLDRSASYRSLEAAKLGAALTGSTMTTEEAAAAVEAERERVRAERRDVIASNKAWKSATVVRREWLTRFLSRKTAPKGAAGYVTRALVERDAEKDGPDERASMACELLRATVTRTAGMYGGYHDGRAVLAGLITTASEARAQVLTLAVILAGQEAKTDTNSWRRTDAGTARYLTFLAEQGYTLADVERRACGQSPLPLDGPDLDTPETGDAALIA